MGFPWALQLVVLSCMAEAVFVVWAWRYSRLLAARRARGETVDAAIELRQARWKSVTASMVRYAFLIAINVAGLRSGASLVVQSFMLFLGLAIVHGQVRFAVEREVRGIEATQFDAFRLATRMVIITLAIYVVYFSVFTGVHLLAMLLTGKEAGWAAIPIGLFAALFVTYLASPILVRMMFPCKRIDDPALIETLRRCFERASLPVPTFWALELDKHRAHNAMVAGLRSGRGILKPALFLSSSLVRELTPEEFEAVILHEVSHVQLNHMRGRMIAALASVCLSVAPIWMLGALGPYLLAPPQFAILLLGSYVLAFFVQYSAMRWTVQLQELEADSHAVIRLGADPDAFSRALTKLMRMNEQLDDRKDPSSYLSAAAAHPTA
ncbi:MAG TPA: M48 family metalloprotease, partial [Bdellovibrionota bacterium]|nr:M48 family metalloprotease [Bdellovibrionota bacterium]